MEERTDVSVSVVIFTVSVTAHQAIMREERWGELNKKDHVG